MDYQMITVGRVIKRFLLGWAVAGGVLTVFSCVKYKEFIVAAFTNNIWAWINAIIPMLIVIFAICYLLKAMFR